MKLNKLFFGLLGIAALMFTACSDDDVDYQRGAWDANANYADIYFQKSSNTIELDPVDPTSVTLEVYRRVQHEYTYGKDSEGNDSVIADKILTPLPALTVKLDITENTDNVFNVSDAIFAEGDTVAFINVSFPNAAEGIPYKLGLLATGADLVSSYSQSPATSLTVTRVKWNDVGFYLDENGNKVEGWCMFTDDYVTGFYGVDNVSYPIKVQERDDKKGYFRLVNVYHEDYPYNDPGDWDTSKDYYIYIDATNPKKVYIPHYCETGMSWSYGMFRISSMAGYYLARNDESSAEGYYGTYANGQITFPVGGLLISMAGYGTGGFYSCNDAGLFTVVIDPTLNPYRASVEKDFDYAIDYEGLFTSEKYGSATRVKLYKGTANNTTDDCDSVFAAEYGTPYYLESPYAEGYNLYFAAKDGEITIPEGYELQPTGDVAAGEDVYAKISTMSTIEEDLLTLIITFQNKSGSVVYGTAEEVLKHVSYTKDMVLGSFNYMATVNGNDYNLGTFTITEDPANENGVILKDFYLEGSEVPGTVDLTMGKLYVGHLAYLGVEEDEGTPYAIYTYDASGNKNAAFDINMDGTLTSTSLILVGTPDNSSLYYWVNASQTTFVPASAARAMSAKTGKISKKGAKLNAKLNKKLHR